jgi:HEAT repeat protein
MQAVLKYEKGAKREAANFVIESCQDKDVMVVKTAIRMLGKIGSKEHVAILMDLGSNPEVPYFEEIIQSVGQLAGEGDTAVVELFSVVLHGKRANLQLAAIDGLYRIGSNEVLPVLSIGLRDQNLQVRQRAADAFVKLAKEGRVEIGRLLVFLMKERDTNVRRIAIEIIDSVGATMPDLWKSLVSYLKDADWWVRERVTDVLVKIGGEKITEHMFGLMDNPKEIVRRYAIEVLVRIKQPKSLPYLIKAAFNDPDWWVRERAVEAIGLLQDRTVVPKLIELLDNEELRWVTVKALGELKDPLAVPHLLKLIATGEPDFRLDVLDSLQTIGDRSMLENIIQLQYDTNRQVREKAIAILKAYQVEVQSENDYYKKAQNLSLLDKLLLQTKKRGGTDMFLHSGAKPYIRYLADVIPVSEQILSNVQVFDLIKAVLPEDKVRELEERGDTDFSYQIEGEKSRFRVNIYKQRSGLSAVFRVINDKVTPIEQLGFSKHVINLLTHHQGMILVTGPAGSGKTTTLMAMIDYINRIRNIKQHDSIQAAPDLGQQLIQGLRLRNRSGKSVQNEPLGAIRL